MKSELRTIPGSARALRALAIFSVHLFHGWEDAAARRAAASINRSEF